MADPVADLLPAGTARVKAARALLRSAERRREGRFLAEGPQAVREAIRAGAAHEVFCTPAAARRHADLLATAAALRCWAISDRESAQLSDTRTPQGILALCDTVDVELEAVVRGAAPLRLVVVLADVRDPGNAGTILRTADAAGAAAVIFAGESVDPHNGKCVRASAGSVFHPLIVRCSDTEAALRVLREAGLSVLTTAADGDLELYGAEGRAALARPTAWMVGNEAWGVPGDIAQLADHTVRIPIYGQAESLNVAAAAAVVLYASADAQGGGLASADAQGGGR